MQPRHFVSEIHHTDEAQMRAAGVLRSRFTSHALDAMDQREAWPETHPTASVNGLPLYAPAQYAARQLGGDSRVTWSKPAPAPTPAKPTKPATTWKGPTPAGGVRVVERDRWPWWIWPLAAAAAVAVRGN